MTTYPPIGTQWPEDAIQRYIAMESNRAGLLFHGDANGSHKGAIGGNKMKLAGARKGWPDLVYILDGGVVWIELKKTGGRVSDEQKELHSNMAAKGCLVYIVYAKDGPDGWVKVRRIILGLAQGEEVSHDMGWHYQ